MAEILLPNVRMNSDFRAAVRLLDNGVAVDWTTVAGLNVIMVSEAQDYAFAGGCKTSIDEDDATKLHIVWPGESQMYNGIHRLVVQVELAGALATYDKRILNVIPLSDTAASIHDESDVDIKVSEVDTSIMTEILRACQAATRLANEAGTHAPKIVEGIWYVYDATAADYVTTGVKATGEDGTDGEDGVTPHIDSTTGNWFIGTTDTGVHAQGERGLSGNINFPTFEIDAAMHLQMNGTQESDADRFNVGEDGHLNLMY